LKLDKSIKRACDGWEKFDSPEEANKARLSMEDVELRSPFRCDLCNKFHIGLEYSPEEEEFDYEPMIDYVKELRDQY